MIKNFVEIAKVAKKHDNVLKIVKKSIQIKRLYDISL